MWEIEIGFVESWLRNLDDDSHDQVLAALTLLSEMGPAMGRPLVDSVRSSRHKNMKALRPGSVGRTEIRILFAFDPSRKAILLIAGDKRGRWNRWYEKHIPLTDQIFDSHLKKLEGGTHG